MIAKPWTVDVYPHLGARGQLITEGKYETPEVEEIKEKVETMNSSGVNALVFHRVREFEPPPPPISLCQYVPNDSQKRYDSPWCTPRKDRVEHLTGKLDVDGMSYTQR